MDTKKGNYDFVARIALALTVAVGGASLLVYAVATSAVVRLEHTPEPAMYAAYIPRGNDHRQLEKIRFVEPAPVPVSKYCNPADLFC